MSDNKAAISLEEILKLKKQVESELLLLQAKEKDLQSALEVLNKNRIQLSGQLELLKAMEESCQKKASAGGKE